MKTYKIEIEETLTKVVEVKAENQEEAYDKVYDQYVNEEIVLGSEDYSDDTKFYLIDEDYNRICEF